MHLRLAVAVTLFALPLSAQRSPNAVALPAAFTLEQVKS
jgi:hypothetical protein